MSTSVLPGRGGSSASSGCGPIKMRLSLRVLANVGHGHLILSVPPLGARVAQSEAAGEGVSSVL